MRYWIIGLLPLGLSGCIAKTALDVVTLPVKAASKTVDVMTTSQSEADEKRGRAVRERRTRRPHAGRRPLLSRLTIVAPKRLRHEPDARKWDSPSPVNRVILASDQGR